MESLIAFLLDNIFIVIIAAGFLMSLLGKGKQQKRAGRMPDFGGGPMLGGPASEDRRSVPEPSSTPSEQPTQPVYASVMSPPSADGRGSRNSGGTVRIPLAGQASRSRESSTAAAGSIEASQLKRIDADDLRQAVLWAEILGPPRARKPHGRHIR